MHMHACMDVNLHKHAQMSCLSVCRRGAAAASAFAAVAAAAAKDDSIRRPYCEKEQSICNASGLQKQSYTSIGSKYEHACTYTPYNIVQM